MRLLSFLILVLCIAFSFLSRLFPNLKNEAFIHEFDPHFNWRCAQYMDDNGISSFYNWFDNNSWYPYGRNIGDTTYPGLMMTVVLIKRILAQLHIFLDLLTICIYIGPIFSALQVFFAYCFGVLIKNELLGTVCAALSASSSGLISRTCAGAFDYECISITLMFITFYYFAKATVSGCLHFMILSSFVYSYMAFTWGGYVYVTNCLPLFVIISIAIGMFSWKLSFSYLTWFVFGTLIPSSLPFIREKVLCRPEHLLSILTFFFVIIYSLFMVIKSLIPNSSFHRILSLFFATFPVFIFFIFVIFYRTNIIPGFSGRILQFFNPTSAKKNDPMIATVVEHQPSTWASYFSNCGPLLFLLPVGYFIIVQNISYPSLMVLIMTFPSLYFASIMVRILLVLFPFQVIVTSIGLDGILSRLKKNKKAIESIMIGIVLLCLCIMSTNSTVFLSANQNADNYINYEIEGPHSILKSDDHREAYRWIYENTNQNSKIISWWDFGYQIASMGERATIVDGNTNNFTHINTVGLIAASPEFNAWKISRLLDGDYFLASFGGASGFEGDDILKFAWMPDTIHRSFSNITSSMYIVPEQAYLVEDRMTTHTSNAMFFKFCYYNFRKYRFRKDIPIGTDIMRGFKVGKMDFKLHYFEEAYTSSNWMIRIYKVLPDPIWNRVY